MLKENERIDQLMQYDLEIIQSPDVFSFSLDAVLLGDFAHIRKRDDLKILRSEERRVGTECRG